MCALHDKSMNFGPYILIDLTIYFINECKFNTTNSRFYYNMTYMYLS